MQQLLSITGPIYLIIALGYLCGRFGLFSKFEVRVLGRFVIDLALPALLFNGIAQRELGEVLNGGYLVAYSLGSVLAFFWTLFVARRLLGKGLTTSALYGMGASVSNSGFFGYPILLQLIGSRAAVAVALSMMVENMVMLPLALALADAGLRGGDPGRRAEVAAALRRLARNPMLMAIFAGLGFAALRLRLPEPVARTVQIVAGASSPVALFVIGGSLVGLPLAGLWREVVAVALGKLITHPLAVLAMLLLLPLPTIDPALRTAAVVGAAMPMLSMYPALAQKYDHEGACAAVLLGATVLAFGTISGVLALLHRAAWV